MTRFRTTTVVAVFLTVLLSATIALGVLYIYEGKGLGAARLGHNDKYAASKISSTYTYKRDTRYSYVVYHWFVGRKMSNGRYPVELYSKSDHRVFRFQINSGAYPTTKGVKVGSTETYLKSRYTNERGPYTSGTYRRYRVGTTPYTDFYCRSGRVAYIIVGR